MEQHADKIWYEYGEDVWTMRRQGKGALLGGHEYVMGSDAEKETKKRASEQRMLEGLITIGRRGSKT